MSSLLIYLRELILELSSFNVVRLLIDAAIIAKLSDEFWAETAMVKVVKCSKEDRLLTEHWKTMLSIWKQYEIDNCELYLNQVEWISFMTESYHCLLNRY